MGKRRRSSHTARSGEARGLFAWAAAALAFFLFVIALLWAADILTTGSAEALGGFALAGIALFAFLTPSVQRRLGRWLDRRRWERWRR